MLFKLFLLFTAVPVIELYILIKIGSFFGIGFTLIIVLGTGFFGAYLTKREGYRVLFQIQKEMSQGNLPASELVDAVLVFVAGIVLLTPGLITDIIGLILLFPITRSFIRKFLMKKIQKHLSGVYVRNDTINIRAEK